MKIDTQITTKISKADVLQVAENLGIKLTSEMVDFVLTNYDNEVEKDPSGDMSLWVENLLYNYN